MRKMLTFSTLESILSACASPQLLSACRRNLSLAPIHPTPRAMFPAASFSASASAFFPLSRSRSRRRRRGSIKNESWWAPRAKVVVPQASEADAFPSERYHEYNRLLPCPLHNTAPRIEHMVVSEGANVVDYISKVLQLPSMYVADLIQFGAIHYALVCPKPPPSATRQEFQIYKEFTEPSVLQKRSSLKGKTVREAQKTYRVTDVDEFVEAGTYLRVHVHPKRYSRCYQVDWKSRIIANTDTYVVLDKPAATSVGGSMDNIEETCATFASRALGLESPLRTTHQLDNCTEGCLVLSKTKEFCSIFHGMIREKQVRKLYLALAAAPVPTGIISHYMRPVNLAPRLVSEEFIEGWHLCQMEILECEEVPWPEADVIKAYDIDECGWPFKKTAYECKINLLTGKTHQVRAQLAAIGAPIVGDSMYMPAALAAVSCPLINPFAKQRKEYSNDGDKVAAMEEWLASHGKEPNSAIGLQASEISWNEGNCSYHAGIPWWRQPATSRGLVCSQESSVEELG